MQLLHYATYNPYTCVSHTSASHTWLAFKFASDMQITRANDNLKFNLHYKVTIMLHILRKRNRSENRWSLTLPKGIRKHRQHDKPKLVQEFTHIHYVASFYCSIYAYASSIINPTAEYTTYDVIFFIKIEVWLRSIFYNTYTGKHPFNVYSRNNLFKVILGMIC